MGTPPKHPAPAAPGLYEALLTEALATHLTGLPGVETRPLRAEEAPRVLARHLAAYVERALAAAKPDERTAVVNHLIGALATQVGDFVVEGDRLRPTLLTAIATPPALAPGRPDLPLAEAGLLTNGREQPRLGAELARELESADRVDLLCAFLVWSGYAALRAGLRAFVERGGRLRVITSSYLGVTQDRVLRDLTETLGAEVRVAEDAQATRLHAKAWIFHRNSGFDTAYVGSSNLSHGALHDGLEWNVRLSAVENRRVLEQLAATFDTYWSDSEFQPFDAARFARARAQAQPDSTLSVLFELRPRPFQREILEHLEAERTLHGRHRNLIVAATGTGKTVVAALDYGRQCGPGRRPTLLFVAHRQEILTQARDTFRHAVGDGSFGELLVGGAEPVEWRAVFASVQSLRTRLERFAPDHFAHVVIDEFHHAEAPTYEALLTHLRPTELVGLTATPERGDGVDVTHHFDGRVAAEIRLWDAIDRGLLVPFQYFVLHDGVDLSDVAWRGGRYDAGALDRLYTGHDRRAHLVASAVGEHVADPLAMRALGFCAGVHHAEYMARAFTRAGIPAAVITGGTRTEERRRLYHALQGDAEDRPRVLFTVDVFNEGVDIPRVDTVLFLRPTESATLFLQQLGRGLRRAPQKRCLTVLDFVGRPRREFRFDRKLRAITGEGRRALTRQVERDFPWLPAGCALQFDRQSREIVLESLRQAIGADKRSLVRELKALGDVSLAAFLRETDLDLTDIYRKRSFADLRRAAGLPTPPAGPDEDALGRALGRLLHVDDLQRLDAWRTLLAGETPPGPSRDERARRLRMMLAVMLFGAEAVADDALAPLWRHPAMLAELRALLALLRDRLDHLAPPWAHDAPLSLHARYGRHEIMAAFDDVRDGTLYLPREGVLFERRSRCNLLFVTLHKDEEDFSASTMYRDYAIAPDRFHWESQSRTRPDDTKGQRHVRHAEQGVTPLLFVRHTRKDDRGETTPFAFLGPLRLLSHQGERPMSIEWALEHPMSEALFRQARVIAS